MLSEKLDALFKSRFPSYTPIQEKAFPVIASGRDALLIAPTGSGKTEAAFLPLLDKIATHQLPIVLLYITPLRALNRDMIERLRTWSRELGIRASVRHGDTQQSERAFQSKHPAHIFITTPETLQAMLCTESFRAYLKNLKYVIVDELHELIGSKRGAQLSLAFTRLRRIADFQTVAISATLTNVSRAAQFILKEDWVLVQDNATVPPVIDVVRATGKNESAKLDFICSTIKRHLANNKTLIFTNTRYMAELVGSRLISDNASVGVHHGSLSKEEREAIENDFKQNKIAGLVCTSSLELGIDIGDVSLVIHIGSPKQVRKCLQRIGRSGHTFGGASHGIIIAHNEFDFLEAKVIAERASKMALDEDDIIYPALDVLGHAVAGELLITKRTTDEELYNALVIPTPIYTRIPFDDFRLLLSEMHQHGVIFYDGTHVRKTLRTREYYFTRLSTIPSSIKYPMIYKGNVISFLDERFVISLEEGDVFITKGIPWHVLSIEEDKVLVDRSPSYVLAIPEWEGEQIPVKKEIAQDVMHLMKFNRPRISVFADMMIFYTFLGNAANNALALALSSRLTNYFGAEVVVKSSPYAIFIRTPYPITRDSFHNAIAGMNIQNEILSLLHKNRNFSFLFAQEAYYSGASDMHSRYSPYYMSKLSASLIYKEAKDYFLFRYCDVAAAQSFIRDLTVQKKPLEFNIMKALDDLARDVLDHMSGSQVLFPDIPESAAMVLLDKMPDTFKFKCVHCGSVFYAPTASLPKNCPKCKSVLLAPLSENEKKELSKDELMRRVALYNSYGRKALLALSTYGVGTETAARILSRLHKDDRALALDLLRAREQFIRTRKYWSPNSK